MILSFGNKAISDAGLAILVATSPSVAAAKNFAYTNSNRVVIAKAQTLPALSGTIPTGSVGTYTVLGDSEGNLGLKLGTINAIEKRYVFTTSAASLPSYDSVYSNNSQKFTFKNAIDLSLSFIGSGAPGASGTLTLVSGTGPATIAFASVLVADVISYLANPSVTVYPASGLNENVAHATKSPVQYANKTRTAIALITVINESVGDFIGGTTALDVAGITVIYSEFGVEGY